jgi:hypothetical protein
MTPTCAAILANLARHYRDRTPLAKGLALAGMDDDQAARVAPHIAEQGIGEGLYRRLVEAAEGEFRTE